MGSKKYDTQLGRNVIKTGNALEGIAYSVDYVHGRVAERYNARSGEFELVDEGGKAVGYVPRSWRAIRDYFPKYNI